MAFRCSPLRLRCTVKRGCESKQGGPTAGKRSKPLDLVGLPTCKKARDLVVRHRKICGAHLEHVSVDDLPSCNPTRLLSRGDDESSRRSCDELLDKGLGQFGR